MRRFEARQGRAGQDVFINSLLYVRHWADIYTSESKDNACPKEAYSLMKVDSTQMGTEKGVAVSSDRSSVWSHKNRQHLTHRL